MSNETLIGIWFNSGRRSMKVADTKTHDVRIGSDGSLFFHFIRRANLSFDGDFLVAKICKDGELLWSFDPAEKNRGFRLGLPVVLDDGDFVVALIRWDDGGAVSEIRSTEFLIRGQTPDLLTSLRKKQEAAKILGRSFRASPAELQASRLFSLQRQKAEETERIAKQDERAQEIAKIRSLVKSRRNISGMTADGEKRFGYPVTEAEWPSLEDGTKVVLVEDYDDETDRHGQSIEAFIVKRQSGQAAQKFRPGKIIPQKAEEKAVTMPMVVSSYITLMNDRFVEVKSFLDMESIREAHKAGLNGDSLVTAEDQDKGGGQFTVYRLSSKSGVQSVGQMELMAVPV